MYGMPRRTNTSLLSFFFLLSLVTVPHLTPTLSYTLPSLLIFSFLTSIYLFFCSEKDKIWQKYVHCFQRYEFRSTQYCMSLRSHRTKMEDFCSISALGTPKPGHQEQLRDETERYRLSDFICGITRGKKNQFPVHELLISIIFSLLQR